MGQVVGGQSQNASEDTPLSEVHLFHFVLLDQFSHLSFQAAVETLQNANLVAGRRIYDWRVCGLSDGNVRSSTGISVAVEETLRDMTAVRDIVIVSGENVFELDLSALKIWLSKVARGTVRVTGLGTAAIVMAEAGLLNETEASIHAWYQNGFREHFPSVPISSQTHVFDGLRCTSSGGVSAIDLFLDFIALEHGADFSDLVSEGMSYTPIRLVQKSVDARAPSSMSIQHPVLSKAIAAMEKTIDDPVSPSVLARDLKISARQLERLFQRYLGTSPARHYMRLRLRAAYRLLVQSRLGITDVAVATGFSTSSHFAKCFKGEFSVSPHELRHAKAKAKS